MPRLTHEEILHWLREDHPAALEQLFARADQTRRAHVGDAIHLRGLIEISSFCVRQCHYCGLRLARSMARYRMTREEILACAQTAVQLGFGTVVLQSGEDFGIEAAWLAEVLRTIKNETPLAITLSLGERLPDELRLWRDAGADRYLLRFETSDPTLYAAIHPQRGSTVSDRVSLLRELRALGYEIGSGVMTGIPGQTYAAQTLSFVHPSFGVKLDHSKVSSLNGDRSAVPDFNKNVRVLDALDRILFEAFFDSSIPQFGKAFLREPDDRAILVEEKKTRAYSHEIPPIQDYFIKRRGINCLNSLWTNFL